jgi:hypothetical protein
MHGLFLRRVSRINQLRKAKKLNGDLKRLSETWVQVESTRFVLNALVFITGVGVIMGFRQAGYLLALIPVASVAASFLALRWID